MNLYKSISDKFRRASELKKRFGYMALLKWSLSLISEKLFNLEVTHVVWLESGKFSFPGEPDPDFTFRFLSPEEVAEYAADPENQIKEEFVVRAFNGEDLCFAALCQGRLAAYGWYAIAPTASEINYGIALSFPSHVACMYEGFTHPDYRGNRLHGFGMGLALKTLKERGITCLVSTINWCNWQSLKSCWRLGYTDLGCVKSFGFYEGQFFLYPKAAKKLGVNFGDHAERRTKMSFDDFPSNNSTKRLSKTNKKSLVKTK